MAGTGRRAGRRARGAWREPPPRSSGAGGAGRGRKPSLNQFKTQRVVTVSTAALFSPRAERRPGRPAGSREAPGPEGPRRPVCWPDTLWGPRPGSPRAGSRDPPVLRCGRRAATKLSGAPCLARLGFPSAWTSADQALGAHRLRNLGESGVTAISNSSFKAPCSDPSSVCSSKHVQR